MLEDLLQNSDVCVNAYCMLPLGHRVRHTCLRLGMNCHIQWGTLIIYLSYPTVREEELVGVDFEAMQQADSSLRPLFEKAMTAEEASELKAEGKECHMVREVKLFRICEEGEQLVVSHSLTSTVLKMGSKWIDYTKSCPECKLTSQTSRGTKAPLVNLPILGTPFTLIAMGIVAYWRRAEQVTGTS